MTAIPRYTRNIFFGMVLLLKPARDDNRIKLKMVNPIKWAVISNRSEI